LCYFQGCVQVAQEKFYTTQVSSLGRNSRFHLGPMSLGTRMLAFFDCDILQNLLHFFMMMVLWDVVSVLVQHLDRECGRECCSTDRRVQEIYEKECSFVLKPHSPGFTNFGTGSSDFGVGMWAYLVTHAHLQVGVWVYATL